MDLGAFLIRQWGLPDSFCTAVQTHHLPVHLEGEEGSALLLGRILFLAVQAAEYFSGEKKENALAILTDHLKKWNYDQKIRVIDLLHETQSQARAVSGLFEIPLNNEKSYLDLIERARTELIHASDRFLDELLAQRKLIESLQKQVRTTGRRSGAGRIGKKNERNFAGRGYHWSSRGRSLRDPFAEHSDQRRPGVRGTTAPDDRIPLLLSAEPVPPNHHVFWIGCFPPGLLPFPGRSSPEGG